MTSSGEILRRTKKIRGDLDKTQLQLGSRLLMDDALTHAQHTLISQRDATREELIQMLTQLGQTPAEFANRM